MVLRCSNGAPFTILAPIPSVRTGIRVQIYDKDDPTTLIDILPDSRRRKWVDPLNEVGAGEFEVHEDDPKLAANPDILRPGNFVRFYLDNVPRFVMRIEKRKYRPVSPEEDAGRWIHVSGRGALAQLEDGAIYPAGGITGNPERDVTGLTPAAAFAVFYNEASNRGSIADRITLGFTGALDTNNQPFNFTLDESVRAGRDDLLAILRRWSEMGVDHHVTHDLQLQLFANGYGVDKTIQTAFTAPVIFRRAHNITQLEIDEDLIIKNTFLVETAAGFFERVNPSSVTAYGRRESYLSFGNTTSGDYVDRATDAAFARLADIRTAITTEILDIDNHRPYVDGGKGDWVYCNNRDGDLERFRILGMTVTETEDGNPIFVPTLNEESAELEARLQKWLRTMDPGTAGGTTTETTAPTAVPAEVSGAVTEGIVDHVASHPHHDEFSDLADVDVTGLETGNLLQWDGSDWVPLDGTEEGDVLYRTDAGLWIPVAGTKDDGDVPTIQANGTVGWEAPPGGGGGGGGRTLIAEVTLVSAGVFTISSIPDGYDHLYVELDGRAAGGTTVNVQLKLQVGNGSVDTGSNYRYSSHRHGTQTDVVNDGAASSIRSNFFFATGNNADSGLFGRGWFRIFDYASITWERKVAFQGQADSQTSNHGFVIGNGSWKNTADAIDIIRVAAHDGTSEQNWVSGSRLRVYGELLPT